MPAAYPNMAEDFDQLLDKANRAEERGYPMPHRQAWNEITDELLILRIVPGTRTAGDIEAFAKRSPLYGRLPPAQVGSNRYYATLCQWAADYVYQFDGKAFRALARRFYSSMKGKLMNQSTLNAIARRAVRNLRLKSSTLPATFNPKLAGLTSNEADKLYDALDAWADVLEKAIKKAYQSLDGSYESLRQANNALILADNEQYDKVMRMLAQNNFAVQWPELIDKRMEDSAPDTDIPTSEKNEFQSFEYSLKAIRAVCDDLEDYEG